MKTHSGDDAWLSYVKAVNDWCRDHQAWLVEVSTSGRGAYCASVILWNGQGETVCMSRADLVVKALQMAHESTCVGGAQSASAQ